jgi:antitoxin component of MazEF toxin-antitoxin module
LRPAAEVELVLENGALRLTPARRRWGLRRMLSKVTKQNLHAEVEIGPAVGREAW